MSSLVLSGDTSGTVTLSVPATAGSNTVTVAAQTGTLNVAGPAFSANASGTQTITSASFVKATLSTETFDTNNCFDSTTNYRFTPTVAGYYQFNGVANITAATSISNTGAYFYKNGAVYSSSAGGPISSGSAVASVSDVIYCNGTTDYIELYVRAVGTGTITVNNTTFFSGCLVRGA